MFKFLKKLYRIVTKSTSEEVRLLTLLLDELIAERDSRYPNKFYALCILSSGLYDRGIISYKEKRVLREIIYSHKPKDALKYFPFFWYSYQFEPREKFLKDLIKQYS